MIKGWTTDPNANEAYRPSSRTASYGDRQRQTSPKDHPEGGQDTSGPESADNETEEYRLRLIVLPGDRGKSGTDSLTGKILAKYLEEIYIPRIFIVILVSDELVEVVLSNDRGDKILVRVNYEYEI